ncbi:hypothetical protein NDR89_19660 [Cupriavidus gilardii]|uniref:Uncharacterized protein n=1 Tax=Cupriavidus gilardii TaxID=82541 RepID=A0ABY4VNP1_9BURK|nr:hypothetical protein [Cupriavidus gilardii]USE78856.1 hypothetical protein NDR89_19660 [Cupriavidus gilardii]
MMKELKPHDPNHPYVRTMKGCGHGVPFTEYCVDCEVVSLHEQYKLAVRTVQSTRNNLRRLGYPLPGCTSTPHPINGQHASETGKESGSHE